MQVLKHGQIDIIDTGPWEIAQLHLTIMAAVSWVLLISESKIPLPEITILALRFS